MQRTDCRNFKEMLDSYLCQELAVETNHAMLQHAEQCAPCRTELMARRQLRTSLQRACAKDCLSAEAVARLRTRLRAEASTSGAEKAGKWKEVWTRLLASRLAVPAVATLALLILGAVSFYLMRSDSVFKGQMTELSAALLDEAAHDHRVCATAFINANAAAAMPESVVKYDPAYLGLEKIAGSDAAGLQLRHAHVCKPGARQFAHLIYTKDTQLISLLVTQRDARALQVNDLPTENIVTARLQQAVRDQLLLGAYQTTKRVVLVVSDLPEAESKVLTELLALPVIEHLRRVENQKAVLKLERVEETELLAGTRGGTRQ